MRALPAPLLLITDRHLARHPLLDTVAEAFAGGCRWISLREKDSTPPERLDLLRRLLALAEPWRACVSVHADVAAAERLSLPAVHLPAGADIRGARAQLGPRTLIGVSTHVPAETATVREAGADYITFGPVLPSLSKPGYGTVDGLRDLAVTTATATLPVVALGGVTAGTSRLCREQGAAAVAMIGAIMRAPDPAAATRDVLQALNLGL